MALTWLRWLSIPLPAQGHENDHNTVSEAMEITSFLERFIKFSMVSKYPVLLLILLTNWLKWDPCNICSVNRIRIAETPEPFLKLILSRLLLLNPWGFVSFYLKASWRLQPGKPWGYSSFWLCASQQCGCCKKWPSWLRLESSCLLVSQTGWELEIQGPFLLPNSGFYS